MSNTVTQVEDSDIEQGVEILFTQYSKLLRESFERRQHEAPTESSILESMLRDRLCTLDKMKRDFMIRREHINYWREQIQKTCPPDKEKLSYAISSTLDTYFKYNNEWLKTIK